MKTHENCEPDIADVNPIPTERSWTGYQAAVCNGGAMRIDRPPLLLRTNAEHSQRHQSPRCRAQAMSEKTVSSSAAFHAAGTCRAQTRPNQLRNRRPRCGWCALVVCLDRQPRRRLSRCQRLSGERSPTTGWRFDGNAQSLRQTCGTLIVSSDRPVTKETLAGRRMAALHGLCACGSHSFAASERIISRNASLAATW